LALTAEERLITIRVKIKRAKKHFSELAELAEGYRYRYTHVAVSDEKPQFSQGFPNIVRLPIVHFDMLAIAGDILHNLRGSLEHVAYHLALVYDPKVSDEVLEKVTFPIGETPEKYESLKRRKIEGVIEPRAIKFIDSLKPYKGGNDALWRLHEANNIDKHRRLISAGKDGILCEGEGFEEHFWLKDQNPTFARVFLEEGEQEPKLFTGITSLLEFRIAEREALVPTLHQLISFVECLIEEFRVFLE